MEQELSSEDIAQLLSWKESLGLARAGEVDAYLMKVAPQVLASQASDSITTRDTAIEEQEAARVSEVRAGGRRSFPDVLEASGTNMGTPEVEALKEARNDRLYRSFVPNPLESPAELPTMERPEFLESFKLLGTVDAAASVISNVVGTLAGAVYSSPELFKGGLDLDVAPMHERLRNAGSSIEAVREAMAWNPVTPAGKAELEKLGEAIGPIAGVAVAVNDSLGIYANDMGVGPTVTTALMMLPLLVEAATTKGVGTKMLGTRSMLPGSNISPDLSKIVPATRQSTVFNTAGLENIQRTVLEHPTQRFSGLTADVKLSPTGQVVPDGRAIDLMKLPSGVRFDAPTAALVTKSSTQTKKGMRRMLDIDRANYDNPAILSGNSPLNVFGESLSKRLSYLQGQRTKLGTKLKEYTESPEFAAITVPVDVSFKPFYESLGTLGIKFGRKGVPNFSGTVLNSSALAGTRTLVKDFTELMASRDTTGVISGTAAHRIKKDIDELIDIASSRESGISSNVQRSLIDLRSNINTSIQVADPNYLAINQPLTEIIGTMDGFKTYLPKGSSWVDKGITVKSAVGPATAAATSSEASATLLANNLLQLEKTVKKLAGDTPVAAQFADEPLNYLSFNNILDGYYGPLRAGYDTLVRGEGSKAALKASTDFVASMATGNIYGMSRSAPRVAFGLLQTDGITKKRLLSLQRDATESLVKALAE